MLFLTAATLYAQQPLDVAREQMKAGRTEDARRIVRAELPAGSELAKLMEAVLAAPADSAAKLLESVAREGQFGANTAQAGERMADLLFAASRWEHAVQWYDFTLRNLSDTGARQRVLIKSARAELARGAHRQALAVLESALTGGETALTGEARYWQGVVLEEQGKLGDAAKAYLAAYTAPDNRLGLAALHRLHNFYGQAGGSNAGDWRKRWNSASEGTIFENRYLPASSAGSGWTVQLGAFSSSARAADHASRVRRLGLAPVIEPPANDNLYRVRIENIPTEEEMKRITSILKRNRLDYHVIKPGN